MKDGAGCIDEKNMTADIARRQKHIYAKSLVLQANVSTSMEQVALAMAPCSIPWPLSEWSSSIYFGRETSEWEYHPSLQRHGAADVKASIQQPALPPAP